jgi:hypothetical protein
MIVDAKMAGCLERNNFRESTQYHWVIRLLSSKNISLYKEIAGVPISGSNNQHSA